MLIRGEKLIEGRLNNGIFKLMRKNDILELKDTNYKFRLIDKRKYKDFYSMLEGEGISKVLPDKTVLGDGVDVYYRFYNIYMERKCGVLALELKII